MSAPLRNRLEDLASDRAYLESKLSEVRRNMGLALLEVRDDDDLSLTEAAGILGISRPTAYCLLEDAGGE